MKRRFIGLVLNHPYLTRHGLWIGLGISISLLRCDNLLICTVGYIGVGLFVLLLEKRKDVLGIQAVLKEREIWLTRFLVGRFLMSRIFTSTP